MLWQKSGLDVRKVSEKVSAGEQRDVQRWTWTRWCSNKRLYTGNNLRGCQFWGRKICLIFMTYFKCNTFCFLAFHMLQPLDHNFPKCCVFIYICNLWSDDIHLTYHVDFLCYSVHFPFDELLDYSVIFRLDIIKWWMKLTLCDLA